MPNNDVTVTYTYNEPNYEEVVLRGNTTLRGTTATVTIDQTELSNKIAVTASDTVKIEVEEIGSETAVEVTVPKTNINEIVNKENMEQLKIETAVGTLSIQKDALETINTEASNDVKITIREIDKNDLTESQKEIVGDNPVYRFEMESGGMVISQFNGNIVVTLPYSGNTNNVKVYYIAEDGTTEEMNAIYKDGTVSFTTNHFSEYFIQVENEENNNEPEINNPPENPKPTTSTSKKKKKKKTETKVEEVIEQPTEEIAKVEETENQVTEEIKLNFTDVKEDGWYCDAIKYAVKNNIAKGTTETTFSPTTR